MTHFLNANQLAEEAAAQGLDEIVTMLEEAAQKAAEAIAAKRGDIAIIEEASNQPGFGGLCVGFGPAIEGAPCPDDFREYDTGSDWAESEAA
jgi:hypothetical protein